MMQSKIVIYEPPLPYLVVTFTPSGIDVSTAQSRTEARMLVSERVAHRKRRERI